MYLEQAYTELCKAFGFDVKNYLVTVGHPPTGARGSPAKLNPAYIDTQWRGNDNEKDGMFSVAPFTFRSPKDILAAMLWAMARNRDGVRHGSSHVGLVKLADSTFRLASGTEEKLEAIIAIIGNPPEGMGDPFPFKHVGRNSMIAYKCACGLKIYATNRLVQAQCFVCGQPFLIQP
jgi:hypothetical protein